MPNDYTLLQPKIEERPFFFEFKKCDFVTHAVMMANLDYDPFPNHGMEDIVRREFVCTELVLTANLQGKDALSIRPGAAIEYEGHRFVIMNASGTKHGNTPEESSVSVEGSCFLSPCEPMKVLAQLRETYAQSNRN